MLITVIIPAAGRGRRFRAGSNAPQGRSKIEQDLAGRAMFLRSVELFLNRSHVQQVILAVDPDALETFRLRWGDKLSFHGVALVPGGKAERWETVQRSLEVVQDDATHIAVHDAARPLTPTAMIDRVFAAAECYDAVIPALPVANTLKRVVDLETSDEEPSSDPLDAILGEAGKPKVEVRKVVETVSRADLVEVQTPQVFKRELLVQAYRQISEGGFSGARLAHVTDDASLVESLGEVVYAVQGDPTNFKITRPGDMEIATAIIEKREQHATASLAKRRLFADDED